jgi:hypothetical protein
VGVLRGVPGLNGRLPRDTGKGGAVPLELDDKATVKALEVEFRSFEETFDDTGKRILELERQFGRGSVNGVHE